MKRIVFEQSAFDDFTWWAQNDKKKNELSGYWSRRITDEHRLVYKPTDDALVVIACRYHY